MKFLLIMVTIFSSSIFANENSCSVACRMAVHGSINVSLQSGSDHSDISTVLNNACSEEVKRADLKSCDDIWTSENYEGSSNRVLHSYYNDCLESSLSKACGISKK